MSFTGVSEFGTGGITAPANTPIVVGIPPRSNVRLRLTQLVYWTGGTTHAVALMKSLGHSQTTQTQNQGDTSLTLLADPSAGDPRGPMAAGDWICVQCTDGSFFFAKLTGVNGLILTLATGLPVSVGNPATVWWLGSGRSRRDHDQPVADADRWVESRVHDQYSAQHLATIRTATAFSRPTGFLNP